MTLKTPSRKALRDGMLMLTCLVALLFVMVLVLYIPQPAPPHTNSIDSMEAVGWHEDCLNWEIKTMRIYTDNWDDITSEESMIEYGCKMYNEETCWTDSDGNPSCAADCALWWFEVETSRFCPPGNWRWIR